MTALYVLVAEVFLYREVAIKRLAGIVRESMVMVGSIILILGVALAFTNFLVDAEVPQRLFEFVQASVSSPLTFLILLNILLLVPRRVLDVYAAVIIMVPLLLPVAVGYGIHPCTSASSSREPADRVLHAADRHEPLHRELPVQAARAWNSMRRVCRSWRCC